MQELILDGDSIYSMTKLIHLICDYGPGDMAWAEVTGAFYALLPDHVRLHATTVPPFDTVATGFILAQLANADEPLRPKDTIIFANTAPRKDNLKARHNNEGEGLLFCTLKNGVNVVAVNSGYSLSFVRNDILELWSTTVEDSGSQFRSRDFFPRTVGQVAREDFSFINHKLQPLDTIIAPPTDVVGYVDSFGNIKTTIRVGDEQVYSLSPGDRVKVRIESRLRTATVATGSFNILEGDLAFAPGSSGHSSRFWELFKRGGSAWEDFGHPANGSPIEITRA